MFITEFDFEMKFEKDLFKANCQVTHYFKKPLYRITLNKINGKSRILFLFYKMAENDFFWFPIEETKKNNLAKALSKRLIDLETSALIK